MAQRTEESSCTRNLMDLPDAVLESIASCLGPADRLRLMAVCKKAAHVTVLAAEATFKINKDTDFARIKKVLDWVPAQIRLEITCPLRTDTKIQQFHNSNWFHMHGGGRVPLWTVEDMASYLPDREERPACTHNTSLNVLLGNYLPHLAFTYRWEAITKITIKDVNEMRCLVPPFLVAACPQLTQLNLIYEPHAHAFTSQSTDALPLAQCSSLKHLQLTCTKVPYMRLGAHMQLPPVYHSVAELRNNLPSVDTLIMTIQNVALVEAFATQLTRLGLWDLPQTLGDPPFDHWHLPHELVQLLRQCSRIERLSTKLLGWIQKKGDDGEIVYERLDYLYFISSANRASLKVIELDGFYDCTDKEYEILLQLPQLTTLRMPSFSFDSLRKDWSRHACSWQELYLKSLPTFTTLANLSLSSLAKLNIGMEESSTVVELPNPTKPGSLAAVQRAADNLAHVGEIVVEDSNADSGVCWLYEGTVAWCFSADGNDHGRNPSTLCDSNYDRAAADLIRIAARRVKPARKCGCGSLLGSPLCLRAVFNWGQQSIEVMHLGSQFEPLAHVWQALQQLHKLKTVAMTKGDDYSEADDVSAAARRRRICNSMYNAAQHYVIPTQRCLRIEFGSGLGDWEKERESMPGLRDCIKAELPTGSKLVSLDHCTVDIQDQGEHYLPFEYWLAVVAPSPPSGQTLCE